MVFTLERKFRRMGWRIAAIFAEPGVLPPANKAETAARKDVRSDRRATAEVNLTSVRKVVANDQVTEAGTQALPLSTSLSAPIRATSSRR